ncbi:uncharacterized protein DEA37_0007886 [Paragonimus westermani]|uniref:Uncharacterized protein n=1 Tax=Paragonimus westermani TaxID=34504 RepID=A0A5J4NUE7_9TREM|nr:uncharacterized protein DEA37_0007886 [Paragonimus westermani]
MLNAFLRTYRSTPNTSGPEEKSPAEVSLGRRIRTPLDLMLLTEPNPNMCNRDGGKKNSHHSQNKRVFRPGDLIYVMNASPHQRFWVPGRVMRRIGSVMYQVQTEFGMNVRHVNHIQHRCTGKTDQLPLDIFLDIFELPTSDLEAPVSDVAQETTDHVECRHSKHTWPPVQRLSIRTSLMCINPFLTEGSNMAGELLHIHYHRLSSARPN